MDAACARLFERVAALPGRDRAVSILALRRQPMQPPVTLNGRRVTLAPREGSFWLEVDAISHGNCFLVGGHAGASPSLEDRQPYVR